MNHRLARFGLGELVHHRLFDYRGVVVDVDPCYFATGGPIAAAGDDPRERLPWYRLLVHDSDQITYVSESYLEVDASSKRIRHPRVPEYFVRYEAGRYVPISSVH